MNAEDDEFNRIEREAAMRMEAVSATVQKPMHPEMKKMFEDYFDKCFRASSEQREWIGLTDEEIVAAIHAAEGFAFGLDNGNVSDRAVIEYVRIVESKLREKNT
jgi:hypothetical protein